jgi:hypothetical protein
MRTSKYNQGYCIVSERQRSGTDKGLDYVFLARRSKGSLKVLVKLDSLRYDRDSPDRLYVSGNLFVLLVCTAASRYTHHFVRKTKGCYCLERGLFEGGHFGGDSAVVIGGCILGTIWVSPDRSTSPGNYLYVYSDSGLKFGRLPGEKEGYNIKPCNSRSFILEKWSANERSLYRSIHPWPIAMKKGAWQLDFRSERIVR